jgi:hypothetical protein
MQKYDTLIVTGASKGIAHQSSMLCHAMFEAGFGTHTY